METVGDAKDVIRLGPFAVAIPPKQGAVLMSRDSSSGITHLRSEMSLCPAYRFCRESRGLSSMLDSDHDQQITILHDLLQAIKEAALKLTQLITSNIEERRKRNADPRMHYSDSRYERRKQLRSLESGLITTTSSSVCALCGVALHLRNSSEESRQYRQFVVDKDRNDDYDILSKYLDNVILKMAYKVPSLEKDKNSVDKYAKGREKISSKTQSTDTSESGLKSKLLFIQRTPSDETRYQIRQDESRRRYDSANQIPKYATGKREYKTKDSSNRCIVNISSTISSMQDASTLTQEVLCPCACGLLVGDGTDSEVSINPMPISKDKFIKTKLEELGLHLNSGKIAHTKVHDDIIKIKKAMKTKKLEKNVNVKRWIEEIVQLRLQMQIEELHKNIQFFKQENEYIRCLTEKCRCLSEDMRGLQQLLPIKDTYSGLTTTIKHIQAKYRNEYGIIATVIGMFRGSINIQQIAARLLAPFLEHWKRDNIITTRASSASRAQASPPSSMILNVY